MLIKRKDVVHLLTFLGSFLDRSMKVKAAYGLTKNKKSLESEAKCISEVQQKKALEIPRLELQEFETNRIQLLEELADRDEEGNAKKVSNGYVLTTNKDEFTKRFEELTAKYREFLDKNDLLEREFTDFLDEDVEVALLKVNVNDLPEVVTPRELEILEPMLQD